MALGQSKNLVHSGVFSVILEEKKSCEKREGEAGYEKKETLLYSSDFAPDAGGAFYSGVCGKEERDNL